MKIEKTKKPGSKTINYKEAKENDIILMHDYISYHSKTPEALDVIIPALLSQGYEFVTVSELLEIR